MDEGAAESTLCQAGVSKYIGRADLLVLGLQDTLASVVQRCPLNHYMLPLCVILCLRVQCLHPALQVYGTPVLLLTHVIPHSWDSCCLHVICLKIQNVRVHCLHLALQVRDTPMPEEYRNLKVTVLCNDCGHRSEVPFHVVGHKCSDCGGYNTRRVGAVEPAAAPVPPS